jgi:general stress protein 26
MMANETVDRLLAAARATMSKVTDCWAATPSLDGGVSTRVVAPIAGVPGEEDWTIWIATSGGSRKAAEIRRAGRLTLGYQHHPDRSYVALMGRAMLIEDRDHIRGRWREAWRLYFPGGPDDPDTIFVKLTVERIELCVPGVSPEPFGSCYDVLERDAERRWRVAE